MIFICLQSLAGFRCAQEHQGQDPFLDVPGNFETINFFLQYYPYLLLLIKPSDSLLC